MAHRASTFVALAAFGLTACGGDPPKPAPAAGATMPAETDVAGEAIDRASDSLRELLPRPLTAADVENVLHFTPIVEEGGESAATREFITRGVDEKEWGTVAARVSMAESQLLMAEHGIASPQRAVQLKADIEVVRPFRKRLDEMDEARRLREAASVDRSGRMVSMARPEFVQARRGNPESWEEFTEPLTGMAGFRVKPEAGEQILLVRARGELGPKTQRFAMSPGGYFVEDADHVVIRPTGGVAK